MLASTPLPLLLFNSTRLRAGARAMTLTPRGAFLLFLIDEGEGIGEPRGRCWRELLTCGWRKDGLEKQLGRAGRGEFLRQEIYGIFFDSLFL